MLKTRLPFHAACRSSRGGFTLVELLVVIGIIAILAGVAMGPITNGLETAKENAAMQTSRSLGLAEFQYAVDNDGGYPGQNAAVRSDIAKTLLSGKYIVDPSIFYLAGGLQNKYVGGGAATGIQDTNVSWAFMVKKGANGNVGLSTSDPDQLPVVWSTGVTFDVPANPTGAGISATCTANNPFGTHGVPVCYKSNSAHFWKAKEDKSVPNFIDASFDPNGGEYVKLP